MTKDDVTQTAPLPEPRPALDADDPRAARYVADYEARMQQINEREGVNAEAAAEAKGKYDAATANLEVAKQEVAATQEHLAQAQANNKREDGTITGTRSATFPEGIQEVPVSLQNHPYLVAHNVMLYGGPRIERKAAPVKKVEAEEKAA